MQFVIYRDNCAQYHWRLMGDDGSNLAVSPVAFGSAEDARSAATALRDSTVSDAGIDG
jgi:uncharacterized protein YegP (UPF0339 family)